MFELQTRGDTGEACAPREPAPAHTLSTKQRLVLEVVTQYFRITGEPCSAPYIARRLSIHHSTVQDHLTALYRTDEMRGHMRRALDNGVTETELKGLITHVAFYAGWPCAVNAGRVAVDVFGPK